MTAPYWSDGQITLHLGDCLEVLAGMGDASVDAVVTDPPYGLEFMGLEFDTFKPSGARLRTRVDGRTNPREGKSSVTVPESYDTGRYSGTVTDRDFKGFVLSQQRTRNVKCPDCGKWAYDHPGRLCECGGIRRAQGNVYQEWCTAWARECLRVLKPGGFMTAFGGTRTWHRLACAIEDAGFEIRDSVPDLTGYDAPGLMWIHGQGFPKSQNAGRAIDLHVCELPGRHFANQVPRELRPDDHVCPESPQGDPWRGHGTAAKPAWEPVIVARKPLEGTLAVNLLRYGTGALSIAECRLEPAGESRARVGEASQETRYTLNGGTDFAALPGVRGGDPAGRWPPNVVLGPGAAAELDRQSGVRTSGDAPKRRNSDVFRDCYGDFAGQRDCPPGRAANEGGASRFFPVFRYEAKAGAEERPRLPDGTAHPTVKPRDLVAWIIRLVSSEGALILDPFAGSGTTGEACLVEGRRCVLIEQHEPYAELIRTRLRKDIQPAMFGEAAG